MLVIVLGLIVFGLICGSFISALVWRVKQQSDIDGKIKANNKNRKDVNLSIVNGRSVCPHCHHKLYVLDLIPIFSWLSLKGKCRYCSKPISWLYPVIEIVTATVMVFSWYFWPIGFQGYGLIAFIFWLVLIVGYIALAIYDIKWFLLPNRIIVAITLITILDVVIHIFDHGGLPVFFSSILGAITFSGIFYILFQFSQGKWIGGGDVKLAIPMGLLVGGPLASILVLLVASTTGTLIALPLVILGRAKRNSHLPFGPLLIWGLIIIYLFGHIITNWFYRY